jgi:hypothetical protein
MFMSTPWKSDLHAMAGCAPSIDTDTRIGPDGRHRPRLQAIFEAAAAGQRGGAHLPVQAATLHQRQRHVGARQPQIAGRRRGQHRRDDGHG